MSEGEFLLMLLTHPPRCSLSAFKTGWCSLGIALQRAWATSKHAQMVAQASMSAGVAVSGHINGIINMSSGSLKFRIDECDWQTTQITCLLLRP